MNRVLKSWWGRYLLFTAVVVAAYMPTLLGRSLLRDDEDWLQFTHPFSISTLITPIWKDIFPVWRPTLAAKFALFQGLFGWDPLPHQLLGVIGLVTIGALTYRMLNSLVEREASALFAILIFLTRANYGGVIWWPSAAGVLMAGLFGLLTIGAYLRFLDSGDLRYYFGALVGCLLAQLSKEEALALPILVGLAVGITRKERLVRALLLTLPFYGLAIATAVIRIRFLANACCPIVEPISTTGPLPVALSAAKGIVHSIFPVRLNGGPLRIALSTVKRVVLGILPAQLNDSLFSLAARLVESGVYERLAVALLILVLMGGLYAFVRSKTPTLARNTALLTAGVVVAVLPVAGAGLPVILRYTFLASIVAAFLHGLWLDSLRQYVRGALLLALTLLIMTLNLIDLIGLQTVDIVSLRLQF